MRRRLTGMRLWLALAALVLVVASCGEDSAVSSSGGLTGRAFLSQSVEGRDLVPDTQIRIQFHDDGRLTASAGCNTMGGTVTTDGDRLEVSELSMTEMGCDPARHEQDTWLADLLSGGPRFALDGDALTLTGGDVTVELLDREVADPDRPLVGTEWSLDSIVDGEAVGSVPQGAGATLRFEDGKALVQVAGCNGGSASYELDGDQLTFGPLAMTKMACAEPAASVERAVVATFDGAVTYEIEAASLRLTHPDGQGLGFRG